MRAADITFLANIVLTALLEGANETHVRILSETQLNRGVTRIQARIRPALFGIKQVAAIIELSNIISMWPEKTVGNTFRRRNGQKS